MNLIRKLGFCLLVAAVGCGAAQIPEVRPLVAVDRRPEAWDLPVDPRLEPLPEGSSSTLGEDFVEPLEAGFCVEADGEVAAGSGYPCPAQSGLLISEARALRDAAYRIRYPELRRAFEADRQIWAAQRELYEAQIAADHREIERLQPTWWETHDGEVLTAVGVVVGAVVTVAVVFAVNQVSE